MKTAEEIIRYLKDVRDALRDDLSQKRPFLTPKERKGLDDDLRSQLTILDAVIDQIDPEPERWFIYSPSDDIREANFCKSPFEEFGWYPDCHYWEIMPDGSYRKVSEEERQEYKKIVGA